MKRDPEPITRSSRMIEAVSVGDRYSLGGSHGQAAAYPKHVHARACVTPRWRVRSNNARRNTRLYDNEAASPKLMPVYYEARPVEIDRDTFDWMPPRPNTIWLPRSAEWKFKSSRRLPVMDGLHYHPNRGARQFSRSLITLRTSLGIWVKFDRPVSGFRDPLIYRDRTRPSETRELARLPAYGVSLLYLGSVVLTFFPSLSPFFLLLLIMRRWLYPRGLIYGRTSERGESFNGYREI